MGSAIAIGKRTLTWSVVVATIAWSMGLATLIAPLAAGAAGHSGLTAGSLIKGSLPAVYYYGADGKRYVFPNEKTYKTWYADFSGVRALSDAGLAAVSIGGNATYRPGSKMVKITTDPKVYAVGKGGVLRWVETEAAASALYGASWASMVEDVPDPFFVNYTVGNSIKAVSDYNKDSELAAATSINADKNLGGTAPAVPAGPTVLTAMDGGSPASATVPFSATNVIFLKLKLSGTGTLSGLKVTRTGLAADIDLAAVKLFDGTTQFGTSQTLNATHQAVFSGLSIPVAGEKILTVAGDIAATGTATSGNNVMLGVESAADLTLSSGSAGGSFPIRGGSMTLSSVGIGAATLFRGPDMPTSDLQPSPDAADFRFTQVRIQAGSVEDITVKQITAIQAGTSSAADLKDIKLKNDTKGEVVATQAALGANNRVVFDGLNIVVKKGENLNLSVLSSLTGGSSSNRTVAFELHDGVAYTVQIVGNTYGFGITPTRNDFCATAGATGGACQIQTIAAGTIRYSRASSSPATGKVAQGATQVPLLGVDYTVTGEPVRITSQTFGLAFGTMTCSELTSITLYDKDGLVVAGPKDCSSNKVNFTESMTVPVGTNAYTLKGNIASGTSAADTLVGALCLNGTTAANGCATTDTPTIKGVNSGKATTINTTANVVGNTLTIQAASLTATTNATPIAGSVVAGVQDFTFANITLDASGGGEDVKVTEIKVTDATGTSALPQDLVNWELWGDADTSDSTDTIVRLDTTNSTASTTLASGATNVAGTDGTVTFTLKTPIRVSKNKSATVSVKADVIAGAATGTAAATHGHTLNLANVAADIASTGWITGTAITETIAGAGQPQIIRASGTLKVELAADRAVAGPIVAGATGISMVKYKLTSAFEDADVTELPLYLANGTTGAGTLGNVKVVKVYKDGQVIGNTAGYTFNSSAKVTVTLDTGVLRVVKDVPMYIELKTDFQPKEQTASGTQARVGIGDSDSDASTWGGAGSYAIVATGRDAGTTITATTITDTGASGGAVNGGNAMGVFDGVLTIGLDANSPGGVQTAGTGKEVLRFWLTATGDEIVVEDLEFIPSSSVTVTGTAVAKLLSSDGVTEYAGWASGTAWGAQADFHVSTNVSTTRVASAGTVKSNGTATGGSWTAVLAIGAGQTKVLKVTLDTTGVTSQKTFQLRIDDGTALRSGVMWYDTEIGGLNAATNALCQAANAATFTNDLANAAGTECVVDSATSTKTLPVSGNGLSY